MIALVGAIVVAFSVAHIASAAPLADGLVGYWNMNGNADEAVNGYDGTVNGGAVFGSSGYAIGSTGHLNFDGVDDSVDVANQADLDMTGAYTLTGYVQVDDVSTYRPILFRGTTNANDIEVYVQTGSNDLIIAHNRGNGGAFDYVGFAGPSLGTPFYLAVVFDGTNVQVYYNGVAATVTQGTTAMGTPNDTNKPWMMGKVDHTDFGGTRLLAGQLDEVRIYNGALSAVEVAALSSYDFTVVLTPDGAVNPIGTDHTVTATLDPALSYIPVLFERSGVNGSDNTFGPIPRYVPYFTDGNGQVDYTFSGTVTGVDTIVGCVDVSWYVTGGGVCDAPFDEPSDSVVKTWTVSNFVTGGGIIKSGKKVIMNFGGTVGRTDAGEIVGNYHIVDHVARKTCHFKDIDTLVFSGSTTTSPVSSVNTATFTATGTCNNGDTPSITVVIKDVAEPGRGSDTVNITGSLSTGGTKIISGGNIQVHPPKTL